MELQFWQEIVRGVSGFISHTPEVVVIIVATWVVSRLVVGSTVRAAKIVKVDRKVLSLVVSALRFVAWVLGIAAALNALGLTQISLALGGSIALIGAALASGLNTIPQDLLAGVFLIGDDEFAVGRRIKTGSIEGALEELTIRKTRIRDSQGNLHTVPNRVIDQGVYTVLADSKQKTDNK